jgi:hypothetical protein
VPRDNGTVCVERGDRFAGRIPVLANADWLHLAVRLPDCQPIVIDAQSRRRRGSTTGCVDAVFEPTEQARLRPTPGVLVRHTRCRRTAGHAPRTCEGGQITCGPRHRAGMHAARRPRPLTCQREMTRAD